MELKPLPLDQFSDALRRHVDAASPPPMRMMAARGLVPAQPHELATLLYQLTFDPEQQIADAARKQLREVPEQVLAAAMQAALAPAVLDLVGELNIRRDLVLESILRNKNTDDDTFSRIARTCSESITELIAANEVRMLRAPVIIEGLYLNPNALTSTLDRLIDLARRNNVVFTGLEVLQDLVTEHKNEALTGQAGDEAAFKAHLEQSLREEAEREEREKHLGEIERTRVREEEQEDERGQSNRQAMIGRMSISQRVRLATLGSAADRDLLVKDNNRLIHMSAARSPKVQLRDIVAWAGNKQLPDNVIGYIANHARYRRLYSIVTRLIGNPKLPLKEAVRLMPQLQTRDLAALAKNRNVSGNLRRMAQQMKETRAGKGG
jgi:hypothetical protein